ncbi:MAG: winged helix-turn-helix domain-containing protein [Bacteroidales bacterium]|nr:winged helix-turn-helix domain-containing protein [Bacteroidales bacterium]
MDIGNKAGIVWRTLSKERQGLTLDELMSNADLSLFDTAVAIGWLAREDKIWITEQEGSPLRLHVECETYY